MGRMEEWEDESKARRAFFPILPTFHFLIFPIFVEIKDEVLEFIEKL
jgi:hypothetical protein